MFNKLTTTSQLKWVFLGAILTLGVGIDIKPAVAGCNAFGCSQSSVAECNPFGCPNSPRGEACTPFGCPPSPQPQQQQPVQPQQPPLQQPLYPYPPYPYPPNIGGSPQAIQQCMESLLYRTEGQKPYPGWICVANDVNCKTVRVRTEISESAAAQACQNAR